MRFLLNRVFNEMSKGLTRLCLQGPRVGYRCLKGGFEEVGGCTEILSSFTL